MTVGADLFVVSFCGRQSGGIAMLSYAIVILLLVIAFLLWSVSNSAKMIVRQLYGIMERIQGFYQDSQAREVSTAADIAEMKMLIKDYASKEFMVRSRDMAYEIAELYVAAGAVPKASDYKSQQPKTTESHAPRPVPEPGWKMSLGTYCEEQANKELKIYLKYEEAARLVPEPTRPGEYWITYKPRPAIREILAIRITIPIAKRKICAKNGRYEFCHSRRKTFGGQFFKCYLPKTSQTLEQNFGDTIRPPLR